MVTPSPAPASWVTIKNKPGWRVIVPTDEIRPYHAFYVDKARRLIRQNVLGKREVCQFPFILVEPGP